MSCVVEDATQAMMLVMSGGGTHNSDPYMVGIAVRKSLTLPIALTNHPIEGMFPICMECFDTTRGWYTLPCHYEYQLACLACCVKIENACSLYNANISHNLYDTLGISECYHPDSSIKYLAISHPIDTKILWTCK